MNTTPLITRYAATLTAIVLALAASGLKADEVTDAIAQGTSAYKSGDLTEAGSQLKYAAGLIAQQKAKAVTAVFPDALSGWSAGKITSSSAGGMMGGGISANRTYQKDASKISIELVMDSPMLQSMMGMINNPSVITMSGGKLINIQGHKTIYNGNTERPELILIIDGNAMFTLKARGESAGLDELKAYGEALDLDAL
jgi:hypothetical protein